MRRLHDSAISATTSSVRHSYAYNQPLLSPQNPMSDAGVIATNDSTGLRSEPQTLLEPPWSRMPPEMWERILDLLWNEPRALRSCELVCKIWQTRSRFHLNRLCPDWLYDIYDVRQLALWTREVPRYRIKFTEVTILGESGPSKEQSTVTVGRKPEVAHMGAFAAMLAGLLPRLEELTIKELDWPRSMPHTVFIHLTAFASVAHLTLVGVTFPSVRVFCRLICALKGLQTLSTEVNNAVRFADARLPRRVSKRLAPPNLSRIEVFGRGWGVEIGGAEVFYQVLSATLPTSCRHLILETIPLKCIESSTIQQLLRSAGPALLSLTIMLPVFDDHFPTALMDFGFLGAARPSRVAGPSELVDRALNLSNNTSLERLWVYLPFPPLREYHHLWVPRFLSHIASRAIREVSIEFDRFETPRDDELLSNVLGDCCPIDGILSRPRFTRLEHVYFNFIYDGSHGFGMWQDRFMPLWTELTSLWYPKLRGRGILQARIMNAGPFTRLRPWTEIDWSKDTVIL